ncbi:MAG: ABC transporter ATP-binding protein [Cryobacterium sp.]|nr:ABC transporter ATP-binding protein [Cryobacterium sp.]MBX3089241.1 ABC transporter ATP-binding protein [Cryobacterium sp.]
MNGLEAVGVSVEIERKQILDGVSFNAPSGELTALIGPNGAGKSTLLHTIAGASVGRVSGQVLFEGEDLLRMPRRRRAQRIALVEQEAHTELALSVQEAVSLGRIPHLGPFGTETEKDTDLVFQSIAAAGLSTSEFAGREIAGLSGGEKQRVLLAKALAQEPELLLLDEPTNHLDIAAQLSVLNLLRRLGDSKITSIAAIHDLGLAVAYADQVVVLFSGKVVASGPVESTITPELIADVFRVRAQVLKDPDGNRKVFALSPLDQD